MLATHELASVVGLLVITLAYVKPLRADQRLALSARPRHFFIDATCVDEIHLDPARFLDHVRVECRSGDATRGVCHTFLCAERGQLPLQDLRPTACGPQHWRAIMLVHRVLPVCRATYGFEYLFHFNIV